MFARGRRCRGMDGMNVRYLNGKYGDPLSHGTIENLE